MTQVSPQLYDLTSGVNKYLFMLSQMALNESWQNGLDPSIWAWVNPATPAGAWYIGNLYAQATMTLNENCRLRTSMRWDIRPVAGMTDSHVILKQHMKWEARVSSDTDLALATCFMGLSIGAADVGTDSDVIGFRYINPGGGVTVEAVCDAAGIETTFTIPGITVTDLHKFEIVVKTGAVEFWVDNIHRTTITTNLSDAVRFANLYWACGAGGGAVAYVGYVNIYPEID